MVCVGLDLGTTTCVVAKFQNTKDGPVVIPSTEGETTTPSFVSYAETLLVGKAAKDAWRYNPMSTIFNAKRHMGTELVQLEGDCQVDVRSGNYILQIGREEKALNQVEVAARLLHRLKKNIGHMDYLVVTVPAHFDNRQRQATLDAGKIAGLQIDALINEPTAAAMGHKWRTAHEKKQSILLVFDLGGGTFDTSIVRIKDGLFRVLASDGNANLGGEDFVELLLKEACRKVAGRLTAREYDDLRAECERAKLALSSEATVDIFHAGKLLWTVTREEFAVMISPLLKQCMDLVKSVLQRSRYQQHQVDEVFLIGGSTRIPAVKSELATLFGEAKICLAENPDEAVALGAAVTAAINSSVNGMTDLGVQDVTPKDLGVKVDDGAMDIVIPKNSGIPITVTEDYQAFKDNQTRITISVYEGDEKMVVYNRYLDGITINIPMKPKGEVVVRVTFTVNGWDGKLVVDVDDQTLKIDRDGTGFTDAQITEFRQKLTADLIEVPTSSKRVKVKHEAEAEDDRSESEEAEDDRTESEEAEEEH